MILGISVSGRKDSITTDSVKAILEASGLEYEFVSLAGKKIGGCIGLHQTMYNKHRDSETLVRAINEKIQELFLKKGVVYIGATIVLQ